MARYLDNQYSSASVVQPIKKGTLQFLQDAWKNALADLIIAFTGPVTPSGHYDSTIPYILYGCQQVFGYIAPGAIFFNGEVYEVLTNPNPPVPGQTFIMNLDTSQYTSDADPTYFSDQNAYNVHNIRRIQIATGASGSGTMPDFSKCIRISVDLPTLANQLSQFQSSTATNISTINGAIAAEITRATNAENAIGTGWQTLELNSDNVANLNSGSITSPGGNLRIQIIGKTIFINGLLSVTHLSEGSPGQVITINLSAVDGMTTWNSLAQGHTIGRFEGFGGLLFYVRPGTGGDNTKLVIGTLNEGAFPPADPWNYFGFCLHR